jgi:hypothetical protein
VKALVATKETQGSRASDFCFVPDDELVSLATMCDRDAKAETPDGGCGCGRAFNGLLCHVGITTAKVAEIQMTPKEFVDYYLGAMQDSGWTAIISEADLAEEAHELIDIAKMFPIGTVVERRREIIQPRKGIIKAEAA